MKFFQGMAEENLFAEYAEVLDWLVDEKKFDETRGWSSGYVGSLTKKIKKMNGFNKEKTYCYDAQKNLNFEPIKNANVVAIFSNGNSECKDFIRHIRNGIAHGNAEIIVKKGELFIEIKDFSVKGGIKQSAYFYFPISYIAETYKLYTDVKHSFENQRKGKRRKRK